MGKFAPLTFTSLKVSQPQKPNTDDDRPKSLLHVEPLRSSPETFSRVAT
jgi:hypothetical protein